MRASRALLPALFASLALVASVAVVQPAGAKSPRYFSESRSPIDQSGTYIPVVGNFSQAKTSDDIIWYAPGTTPDLLWTSRGNGAFTPSTLRAVDGTFVPVVGDFAGDGRDDIFWYGPGTKPDLLWKAAGTGGSFQETPSRLDGSYFPVVVPNQTHYDEILWWNPQGASLLWSFRGESTYDSSVRVSPSPHTQPYPGDFDGDGNGDILWYGKGAASDSIWYGKELGGFTRVNLTVNGTFQPIVHAFTPGEPSRSDILWYRWNGTSVLWQMRKTRSGYDASYHKIPSGWPVAADGQHGAVFLTRDGQATDWVWSLGAKPGAPDVSRASGNTKIGRGYQALPGAFVGLREGLFFYKAGPDPEHLFYLSASS